MFYEYNHLGSPDYLKIEKNNNFSFPSHLHQCFEIIIILSGEMEITIDTQKYVLKKGEASLIFPNQIHELKSQKSEHVLCIFSPRLVQAYATKITDKIPVNNKFCPDGFLIREIENLDTASSALKKGVLYSLCGRFDATAEYTSKKTDQKNLLHTIFSFVENNFSGDCSLARLSKITSYDYSYLSRYFKKNIGISFVSYVMHYRLSHACYLLQNTTQSIARCAFESGFSSLRTFNRAFKENIKISPNQYRKNISL
ncbi:MAG: AraC family transcriptional regulator [Clostridia bacterium]|nr:AraC family transcriptional regulator [Clostridia bacterium]